MLSGRAYHQLTFTLAVQALAMPMSTQPTCWNNVHEHHRCIIEWDLLLLLLRPCFFFLFFWFVNFSAAPSSSSRSQALLVQAHMTQAQVMGFDQLSSEQQEQTLQLPVMAHLHRRVWSDGLMMLSGATTLISQVLTHCHAMHIACNITS